MDELSDEAPEVRSTPALERPRVAVMSTGTGVTALKTMAGWRPAGSPAGVGGSQVSWNLCNRLAGQRGDMSRIERL